MADLLADVESLSEEEAERSVQEEEMNMDEKEDNIIYNVVVNHEGSSTPSGLRIVRIL